MPAQDYVNYLRYRATRLESFYNRCHTPDTGEFCSGGFFHGSDEKFEAGDILLPQSKTGNVKFLYADKKKADNVYLTDSDEAASYYGKYVYEVEPLGSIKPDPDEEDAFIAPTARVIRRIETKGVAAAGNPCHNESDGRFCETPDTERYYKDYKLEYISPEMGSGLHKIVATQGDTKVAQMQWSSKQIEGLDVNDEHQRKGIARAMWNWGQEMRPKPKHSNDRTEQGDLWAKAIGGKLPRLKAPPGDFATTDDISAQQTEFHLTGQHDQSTHGNRGGGNLSGAELQILKSADPAIRSQVKKLLTNRKTVEPKYTETLTRIAQETGGEPIGLQFKFKEAPGIIEKIQRKVVEKGITAEESANRIADSLRYTLSYPPAKYADGVAATINTLIEQGVTFNYVEDNWIPGDAYNGINTSFQDPDTGLKIELQFHTPDSFRIKDREIHDDYKFIRERRGTREDRKLAFSRMVQKSDDQEFPSDLSDLTQDIPIPVTTMFRPWDDGAIAAAGAVQFVTWTAVEDLYDQGQMSEGDWQDWVDSALLGEHYDETGTVTADAAPHEFYNQCHDPESGRFCDEPGHPRPERDIPVTPYDDEDEEADRLIDLELHYGRTEFAEEMGGTVWAFEGESPGITAAAEDILQGFNYDPDDKYAAYYRTQYDVAETILKTLENETSDVTLYSGHHRPREQVDSILEEGVFFPLVAASPDSRLAEDYAGQGTSDTSAVVFEFPPGTQAGFYRANEHIATGEFEVESYEWADDNRINIKLRQTNRSIVSIFSGTEEEE